MILYDLVFGCLHKHCTFPITIRGRLRRSEAAAPTGTYVVCLECGKEFPYDWETMEVLHSKPEATVAHEPITILVTK
jgi:hypothetical protein